MPVSIVGYMQNPGANHIMIQRNLSTQVNLQQFFNKNTCAFRIVQGLRMAKNLEAFEDWQRDSGNIIPSSSHFRLGLVDVLENSLK